ncbi:MAG: helix-hairpin-helix domain-containing protein [Acholeplasmatales bacterium]|nr:helix-hairpin-helix domain-containing protein [Acholeplasmatales bacterium]
MYKKKEYIIIGVIIALTLLLAFMPTMITSCSSEDTSEVIEDSDTTPSTITITVKGEIKVEELSLEIPYGYSYGYIISRIEPYLNEYSVVENDRTVRYYESTTITIASSDEKTIEAEIEPDSGLINVNTASLSELMSLTGVGTKRAERILDYRSTKTIETFEELQEIIDVTDAILEIIKTEATM